MKIKKPVTIQEQPIYSYPSYYYASGGFSRRYDSRNQYQNVVSEAPSGDSNAESQEGDRKSTRLNSSHVESSYAVFCLKKKNDKLSPLCPRCGIPFPPNTTLHGQRKRGRPRKYCSAACAKEAYEYRWKVKHDGYARLHRYANCAECGEKVDRSDTRGRRRMRYCSDLCRGQFLTRAYRERQRMGLKLVKWFFFNDPATTEIYTLSLHDALPI